MRTSESIVKIAPAYLKAQTEIESVVKDATNPYFKSSYATLIAVIDAIKTKLNKQGIMISQPIMGTVVQTRLTHESGEWFEDDGTPIVCAKINDPQAQGSAITYARRYGLMSMVCLPAEDDDGESAMNRNSTQDNLPVNTTKGYSSEPTPQEKIKLEPYFIKIDKISKEEEAIELEETVKTANLSPRERFILTKKIEDKRKTFPIPTDLPF